MKTPALFRKNSAFTSDTLHWFGTLLIVISFVIFCMSDILSQDVEFPPVLFCYSITAAYTMLVFIKVIANHRWAFRKGNIIHTTQMLLLWFISAFALNKEMNVFECSSNWVSICLCICCTALIASTVRQYIPVYLKHLMVFLLGVATILFAYYSIYLVPLYAIGLLAAVFLGLSLHAFIPLLLTILTINLIWRITRETPASRYVLLLGLSIPLLCCTAFVWQWRSINEDVQNIQNQNTLHKSKLPEWTKIAQLIPHNFVTEKFLKANLVYSTPSENSNWFWGDFGGSRLDEPKRHDPMVMIAECFVGKSGITDEDKIKILKASYNARHLAQERLWSGDHLSTKNVVTNIRVFPEFRLAYTEKTLTIQNNSQTKWNRDEEAIYTFHLPEGSTVSALSLWIDGKEEQSRLTTKGKADSAYKTIVGVEVRDPSVLHWQEGNTVSVRIFPCNQTEDRKFKIGVTSPLRKLEHRLLYENIWFDGPSASTAVELLEMTLSSSVNNLSTVLAQKAPNTYTGKRNYVDRWDISMDDVPLSKKAFYFDGQSYHLQEAKPSQINFDPKWIYLDINSTWSEEEVKKIWERVKNKKVYVYDEQLTALTEQNLDSKFKILSSQNFSLFPFYKIKDPENALVITKSNELSPNFSDLEGSEFQKRTSDFLHSQPGFHLYQIGMQSSPYLKTLKEFRTFHYSEGSLEKLVHQLTAGRLEEIKETETVLNIPSAQMAVVKTAEKTDTSNTASSDHLLRLFAYNDILKKVGPSYFTKDYVRDDLIRTADQAFVVSPISSLIVLETQKDYERFGIDENKDSLKNATMNSSGAAPEPEEWMLIILTILTMAYILQKNGYLKTYRIS